MNKEDKMAWDAAFLAGYDATIANAETEKARYLGYASEQDVDPDFWFAEECVVPSDVDATGYCNGALAALNDIL